MFSVITVKAGDESRQEWAAMTASAAAGIVVITQCFHDFMSPTQRKSQWFGVIADREKLPVDVPEDWYEVMGQQVYIPLQDCLYTQKVQASLRGTFHCPEPAARLKEEVSVSERVKHLTANCSITFLLQLVTFRLQCFTYILIQF